ncbi:MAG: hypothetical protein ACOH2J_11970 [Allorhizobium sp.]
MANNRVNAEFDANAVGSLLTGFGKNGINYLQFGVGGLFIPFCLPRRERGLKCGQPGGLASGETR